MAIHSYYSDRMKSAKEEEKAFVMRVEKLGCEWDWYGQALFSERLRDVLKVERPTVALARWLADVAVWRSDLQPPHTVELQVDVSEPYWRSYARSSLLPKLPIISLSPNINESEWRWFVDVKSGQTTTPNWDLEQGALLCHRAHRSADNIPIVIAWPDGITCSYVEDITDDILVHGPTSYRGSGTPYWLIPKNKIPYRTLEDVFGRRKQEKEADD